MLANHWSAFLFPLPESSSYSPSRIGCVHTPQDCTCTCPIPSTLCVQRDCKQGSCVDTNRCLTSPDPCFRYDGTCVDPNTVGTRRAASPNGSTNILFHCWLGCNKISVCDDNNPCTVDTCTGGVCSHDDKCKSTNDCKIAKCDAASGST